MTTRSVPSSVAPILEELELEQPKLVTADLLSELRLRRGVGVDVDELVERLRRHGWLLDLKTRGVWEFAPAARAGALGSGDPLIELRATLRRRPDFPVSVAAESAAWLHGLSGRAPGRHVIAVAPRIEPPPALRGFRIVRYSVRLGPASIDDLPVWRIESLLVAMATRPTVYRDWPNVGDWLTEAVERVRRPELQRELEGRKRAAWARLAYLVSWGGREDLSRELVGDAPPGTGPFYLGPRARRGRFDARYGVIDSYLGAPPAGGQAVS